MLGRDTFEFRCIFDDKSRKDVKAVQLRGSFDQHKNQLRRLNNDGYGIFVQVNAANGHGNSTKDIQSAPCYFADFDGVPRENINRIALAPTMVIESSPGKFHAYWRISAIDLETFKHTQQRLITICDSDRSVCDLPRVMRLPGFLHQKNPAEPFLTTPVQASDHIYSEDQFTAALKNAEEKRAAEASSEGRQEGGKNRQDPAQKSVPDLKRAENALRFLISIGELLLNKYDQ